MNRLEEIREYIKNFICEKEQVQEQIAEIEEKRTQLAQQRNEKKKSNSDWSEINELGRQITELGNQSQELQNKLNFKYYEVKSQANLVIDNLITEKIRGIRIINEQISELFKNAIRNIGNQDKETTKKLAEVEELKQQVRKSYDEITELSTTKRELKYENWNFIIEDENTSEEIYIEPLIIEEMEPIEEISIEEFVQPEELYVEEFQPIEELHIEEFKEADEAQIESQTVVETAEEKNVMDEIEKLARAIVEEIVAEQTREETTPEDIIAFEDESENKQKVIIPLFGQRATISNITVKIEDRELVYKAQMSDGEEIKIYPARMGEENVLLRDKQSREECKEILINYSIGEYRMFDKKVVSKIDPLICELLSECAERYGYNAPELIYDYAMSFSHKNVESNEELVPTIVYNLSYMEQSNLNQKEKAIINKICRNANKSDNIDIIGTFFGFKGIKYLFKKLFAINNIKVLPEAKY